MTCDTTQQISKKVTLCEPEYWLGILRDNRGFSQPERWIDYAQEHNFTRVQADTLQYCPDCGAQAWKKVGQYVYYSTLIQLNQCKTCDLVFSDTRINSDIIQRHFELAYVDEDYFRVRRNRIFAQIVALVDRYAPGGGTVLDVGGAKGHLMAALKQRRKDLTVVVNDLSKSKCEWVETHYQLMTLCGSAAEIPIVASGFNVVTMIDVIYYEQNISKLWSRLPHMIVDGGVVVMRIPNNFLPIVISQLFLRCTRTRRTREMETQVEYFNPEHLYVFSKQFLQRRLRTLGFSDIVFMPSALLIKSNQWWRFGDLYYFLAKAVHFLSFGHLIITSSVVVVAKKARPMS